MTTIKQAQKALDRIYIFANVDYSATEDYQTITRALADAERMRELIKHMIDAIDNNGIESHDVGTENGVHQFHDQAEEKDIRDEFRDRDDLA